MKESIVKLIIEKPQRFQDLAGTTSKKNRAEVRAVVDELVGEGEIKLIWIGRIRYYAAADWQPGIAETLARIESGSVPGEDGCILWTGYIEPEVGPVIRLDGIPRSLRRIIWEHKRGPLGYNDVIKTNCDNEACIEYRHYTKRSRGDAARGKALPVAHTHKIAQSRRKGAKLSMELAREIRSADGSQTEKSRRYGVCQATIGAIERHEIYREHGGMFTALIQSERKRA